MSLAMLAALSACDPGEPAAELDAGLEGSSLRSEQDYARNPPSVETLELHFLSTKVHANARLEVRFGEGEVQEPTLPLELDDDQAVLLRDDGEGGDVEAGDGLYSAIIDYDLLAEVERRMAYLERVEPGASVTRFEGRNAVETVPFEAQALDFALDGGSVPPAEVEGLFAGVTGSTLTVIGAQPAPLAGTTDPEKTLAVRDPAVTRDASRTGVWSLSGGKCSFSGDAFGAHGFSHLMEEMSAPTGVPVEDWIADWLRTWSTLQQVNGQDLPAQVGGLDEVWNRFPFLSDDGQPQVFTDTLDVSRPPFQLVAIVNRVDLHEAEVFGGGAGELRYVFQLVDPDTCEPLDMTVIFEYAVPRSGCRRIREYAQDWYALDALPLGSTAYLDELEQITATVVGPGNLAQLRTNSRLLPWPDYANLQWHMREFVDDGTGLTPVALAKTPAYAYEYPDPLTSEQGIDAFITSQAGNILASNYDVDLTHPVTNQPFRAAFVPYGYLKHLHSSPYAMADVVYFDPFVTDSFSLPGGPNPAIPPGASGGWANLSGMQRGRFWGSQSAPAQARHEFSLNTCNGCHDREVFDDAGTLFANYLTYGLSRSVAGATQEQPFLHMRLQSPVDAGPAIFSRFLTGTDDGCTTANGLVPPLGTDTCTASCCPVGDPVHGPEVLQYHYDDLARRSQELEAMVAHSCLIAYPHQTVQQALSSAH
ncbi:putative lipoprotein [Plesiocystis pacifica SIR-1]|uniref:Putative lipoprotein n=1 Tax=Plesiocystis pacifica SIR-1 TaxID=391625 RepID=A6GB78_9BACT|nr:choice-of-anchor X domain-containing protein [Plesiocystis pacifica]EDM76875.1 putative lipoprotein [Plesiocystis pacifica SIR-1]